VQATRSTPASTPPGGFIAERAELLQLLLNHGILHRSPSQPVLSRDGTSARWMLNSLAVTLTPRGAELAGRCLLELLGRFDGRQLATYGLTGVPILQSALLESKGRYTGLLVRKARKTHGSLKLIEGPIDPYEPVIMIDDSISSGMSMREGCKLLQEAGLRVEGGICLVRFGWNAGFGRMRERGFHVEALYDIYEDFMANMEGEPRPIRNPSKWFPDFEWATHYAPEGLHPAKLARLALDEYLNTGRVPRPPSVLDRDYDCAGGTWVSVRSRDDVYIRHARDGFWNFPGEPPWSCPEGLVRAAIRTAHHLRSSGEGRTLLANSNIAVTFFSALEECTVGELDNDRYGIVVCSRERPSVMGGALPRMPGIAGEWEQFRHAGKKNGQLHSVEPFVIYRHDVSKAIEPDANWQPSGVPLSDAAPWRLDASICGRVAARARDIVIGRLFGEADSTPALPRDLLPAGLDSIYVTIYLAGHLRGCMGAVVRDLDGDITNLALAALADERFGEVSAPANPEAVAVTLSFLYNPLELGPYPPDEVGNCVRLGQQALMVYQGARAGLLLPFVAVSQNLNISRFVEEVLAKSGITGPPYAWRRFDCVTWLAGASGVHRTEGCFPVAPKPEISRDLLDRLILLQTDYLARNVLADGSFYVTYHPFQNVLRSGAATARFAHAAWVLARTAKLFPNEKTSAAADSTLSYHLSRIRDHDGAPWIDYGEGRESVAEVSFLLLALTELPAGDERREHAPALATTLWRAIDAHGRISTHRSPADDDDVFQDYFPGQVLLALAAAVRAGFTQVDEEKLDRAFRYYRRRFRYKRDFGQVSWLMQSFAAWSGITREPRFAELVFEVGEWILSYQQLKTGAFINDHQSDTPGYTSALYLEGIAAALAPAGRESNGLYERYLESYKHGLGFLERLIIQARDAALLPNPRFAAGGLRQSVYRSEVRIDFVQHSLAAMLEAYPHLVMLAEF
jgi:orotate phosphoribosyltransferase/AMMECR1 domain-containing protein